jgi:hypothetical protein
MCASTVGRGLPAIMAKARSRFWKYASNTFFFARNNAGDACLRVSAVRGMTYHRLDDRGSGACVRGMVAAGSSGWEVSNGPPVLLC